MSLAAVKTFVAAEILYASDLNALNTNILSNPTSLISPWTADLDADGFDLLDLGEAEFRDESADPTADGRLRRSGDELTWRTQDGRTNTTARNWTIWADTTGTPAASIGIGMLFQAESADENPSDFGALDFIATDIGAGTEDTVFGISLRIAGAALTEAYRFASTGAFLYTFTGAPTAARTITLPDADATVGAMATQAEMEAASSTTVSVSPGRTQYHPGVAKAIGMILLNGTFESNSYNISSVADTGAGVATVTMTTAVATAGSVYQCTTRESSGSSKMVSAQQTSSTVFIVTALNDVGGAADPGVGYSVAVFGDQA